MMGEQVLHRAINQAIVQAFADEGLETRFTDSRTLSISSQPADVFVDVSDWYVHVYDVLADCDVDELPMIAANIARGFAQEIRTQAGQGQALEQPAAVDIEHLLETEALRVRIYPEAELAEVPGLRDSLLTRQLAPGLMETVVIDLPDAIMPLNRWDIGSRTEDQLFGAALHASVNREPHYTEALQVQNVPIMAIGETHRYIGSHVHVLKRHLGPAPHGALVSFPLPEYLLVHEIGSVELTAAMEAMRSASRTLVSGGEKALTSQLYWWRPGTYEQLPEWDALACGAVPDLRLVGVKEDEEVDTRERSITFLAADTMEPVDLRVRDHGRLA
ncbi:hypothetical protein [Nonomuraea cavernae]|uniref:hypothetical protein n=1 Tax=Nonomuraea cavernae TaxID=2045107 RepID=UPI00166D20D0|nr:hypothetical protein [Nonomuraea cavernae]MCA2188667.1 hypothetical protein [Nonomuraea cavernae]